MNSGLAVPAPLISALCFRLVRGLILIGALIASVACSTVPKQDSPDGSPPAADASASSRDPLEGFNRAMYSFNDKLDRYALKPVAKGYRAITPEFVRKGVSNFFGNLHDPVIMVNNLLQGKPGQAASDLGRFLVNTTIGVAGLFDIASKLGLDKHDEDFGQTLAVWGVGEGPYLVLPVFGPSNLRDGFGMVPDWELYPRNYVEDSHAYYGLLVLETVNRRTQLLDASDILEQAGGQDPYVFVREAYRQQRRSLIYDGNPPTAAPDPSLFEDDSAPAPSGAPSKTPPKKDPAPTGASGSSN